MQFFEGWVLNIVAAIIFVIIIEIILPGGSTRKYISLVTGLMVMFVIINPFVHLMSGGYDLDLVSSEMSRAIAVRDVENQAKKLKEGSREGLTVLYKNNLEQGVARQVIDAGFAGQVRANVEVDENYESESFGSILGIRVVVDDTGQKEDAGIKKVDRITVKVFKDTEEENAVEAAGTDSDLAEEIKGFLSQIYGLPGQRIDVTLRGED